MTDNEYNRLVREHGVAYANSVRLDEEAREANRQRDDEERRQARSGEHHGHHADQGQRRP
jgi:hypothetical protein